MKGPIARGVVLTAARADDAFRHLEREAVGILKALGAEAEVAREARADADFILLLVDAETDTQAIALPDLKDRAAIVAAIGEDAPACRASIARARKRLRAQGATLGARELVFTPAQFGYLGLESDGLREKLEILLRSLANDAERLRLRREGWEEPDA